MPLTDATGQPEFVIPHDRLPDGFARSIETPPDVPVRPRPAATIALMRDGDAGPEVLLMRRSRRAGFVPGAYVFPGGRVDTSDADPGALARLDGLDADEAARRLDLIGAEPPAIAYYLAAIREAFEETGILVGVRDDHGPPPTAARDADADAVRNALMDDEVTFGTALERLGCRVAGDSIEYLAHWITPLPEPRRYDTRFFLAEVPADTDAIVDPREMTDALWVRPDDGLARHARGELSMIFPTLKTLQTLEGFASVRAALLDLGPRPVPTILPRLVVTEQGVGTVLEEAPR